MEVLFSVEYIITPFIIDGVFNWLFPVLWVMSVYYCIGDPLLNIYPTSTLRCVSFALFLPFSLSAWPIDVPRPWQRIVSFQVCSTYSPFLFNSFLCSLSLPVSTTFSYQTWYAVAKNPYHFIIIPPHHIPLHPTPLKRDCERSELLESRKTKPTTWGFGAYCSPPCLNRPWTAQGPIWNRSRNFTPNPFYFSWSQIPCTHRIGICSSPFGAPCIRWNRIPPSGSRASRVHGLTTYRVSFAVSVNAILTMRPTHRKGLPPSRGDGIRPMEMEDGYPGPLKLPLLLQFPLRDLCGHVIDQWSMWEGDPNIRRESPAYD